MRFDRTNIPAPGLTSQEVLESRAAFGANKVDPPKEQKWLNAIRGALREPMLVLLAIASTLYFMHGDIAEGVFLFCAIILVYSISHYQEQRSKSALDALNKLTEPTCKAFRDNEMTEVNREDLVVNDIIVIEEGMLIPADGVVIQSNDFSVNEANLTGESLPVEKDANTDDNLVYQGTLVLSGLAVCRVVAVGVATKLGEVEKSVSSLSKGKSPLEKQINNFVKKMAAVGIAVFLIILAVNLYTTESFVESLLNSLTLAMSILPEEIPVAFATFMALGAWRLMRSGIIVKETKTVETLGSATVICVDKTGTITKNEMRLTQIYVFHKDDIFDSSDIATESVITTAMWASEPIPFDPMEKAIHECYAALSRVDERPHYNLVKEYPLSGKPPLMTHVLENRDGHRIIAIKGAPEAVLRQSTLSPPEQQKVNLALDKLTASGYRVLGVGTSSHSLPYPVDQSTFKIDFEGLVAFFDPPKENIPNVINDFHRAGIKVKIVTGDNAKTTGTIARQIGLEGADTPVAGDDVMKADEADLAGFVQRRNIFTRMFPEAKLRVIEALKKQGEITAMTGDGVNDAPALKSANIGIAMGHKGSEIAKQAAAMILVDDDLEKMVQAVASGRRIYGNLKKAIQYIISIHIPIILIVFLPLVLGWVYPTIFSPVHVIFLELIMGPTCSIVYENEPGEENAMDQPPRIFTTSLFNRHEMLRSVTQGLAITAGLIGIYWYAASTSSVDITTALVFISLISANICLTLVNRSYYYSVFTTLRYRNNLIPLIITVTIVLVGLLFYIPAFRRFFEFGIPNATQAAIAIGAGLISVLWFEIYKWIRRIAQQRKT